MIGHLQHHRLKGLRNVDTKVATLKNKEAAFVEGKLERKYFILCGGRSRGRTDTSSERRQILSLVRLPIPPFGHGERALLV